MDLGVASLSVGRGPSFSRTACRSFGRRLLLDFDIEAAPEPGGHRVLPLAVRDPLLEVGVGSLPVRTGTVKQYISVIGPRPIPAYPEQLLNIQIR